MLFHRELGVPIVNSSFTYYRDVFLLALAVRWDLEVARFDLVPDQARAAFSLIKFMQRSDHRREFANRVASPPGERPTGGSAGGAHEAGTADAPGADDPADHVLPHKYALTKAHVRAVRKQAGASKWAIRLRKLIQGYLDAAAIDPMDLDGMDVTMTSAGMGLLDATQDVWDVILKTADHAQGQTQASQRKAEAQNAQGQEVGEERKVSHGRATLVFLYRHVIIPFVHVFRVLRQRPRTQHEATGRSACKGLPENVRVHPSGCWGASVPVDQRRAPLYVPQYRGPHQLLAAAQDAM